MAWKENKNNNNNNDSRVCIFLLAGIRVSISIYKTFTLLQLY